MTWQLGWQIEGYAGRWNRPFRPLVPGVFAYAPGCFSVNLNKVGVWFMHRPEQAYMTGAQGALQVWQDGEGLAFRIASHAVATREGLSLATGIAAGRYCEVSAQSAILKSHSALIGGEAVSLMREADLLEISICPQGACPGTGAWLSRYAHDLNSIPPNAREACAAFQREQVARPTPPLVSLAAGSPSYVAVA